MATRHVRDDCCESRLSSFLNDQLPEHESRQLADHLDACDGCRQTLERLAGGSRIHAVLRGMAAELAPEPPRRVSLTEPFEAHPPGLPKVDDLIALDFLKPPVKPGTLGRLGPYDVTAVLGQGAFGLVLKAYDPALSRFVAIKVLACQFAVNAAARSRFAREARAAAAVVHDNVVAIHAVDSWNGLPYLVMPYIAGCSLQERVDRGGSVGVKEVLRVGMQAARGLAAAHDQGLVHRDVKPSNILLENGVERVKLSDFGLARAVDDASQTRSGIIAGTPQYMSPEQARGDAVDHRSDLFSLGGVMYFMCAGHPPFRADSTPAVLRRVCDDRPRPLREVNTDVPDWLAAIIDRLLTKEASGRFATANEVAEVLQLHLADLQRTGTSSNRLPNLSRSPGKPLRKKLLLAMALALAVLGTAAVGGLSGHFYGLAASESGNAPQNAKSKNAGADGHSPIIATADAAKENRIIGSGIAATKVWDVADFTSVQLGSTFRVVLKQGDKFKVTTTSDNNVVAHLVIVKDNKMLKIGLEPSLSYQLKEPLRAEVVLPVLDRLDASGASRAELSGFRSGKNFKLNLHGASELTGSIEAGDAEFDVSGASHLTLKGSAVAARFSGRGASHLKLAEFPVKQCEIQLSGASLANITVQSGKPFKGVLSGASSLKGSVDAADVTLKLESASHAVLQGKGVSALLSAGGASHLGLSNLVLSAMVIELAGASHASVDARKSLVYKLSSSSGLEYSGDPAIMGTKAETASVRRRL